MLTKHKPPLLLIFYFFLFTSLNAQQKHTTLTSPALNISFLDCIPPTGTKLATGLTTNTKVYGPQSELNHLGGSKKRTLYFYFGMPKTISSKEQYSRPAIDDVF